MRRGSWLTLALVLVASCGGERSREAPEAPPRPGDLLADLPRQEENVGHEIRRALPLPSGRTVRKALRVPCGRSLEVGLAGRLATGVPTGARFEIALSRGEDREIILERELSFPEDGQRWIDLEVPAPNLCGEVVVEIEARWQPEPEAGETAAPPPSGEVDPDLPPVAAPLNPDALLLSHLVVPVEPSQVVVLALVDALRADRLGAYGASRPLSPNVDRLSRGGVTFTRAVATASWTRSSVGSLFTGELPYAHGVLGRDDALEADRATLAEVLSDSGIETVAFVANGNIGFQRLLFHRGFDTWRLEQPDDPTWKTRGELLLPALSGWMRRPARSRAFVYVHTVDPHAPYQPLPPFAGLWMPRGEVGVDGSLDPETGFYASRTEADLRHVRDLYDEEVAYADWVVGAVRARLHRSLPSHRFILCSDHGESFREHGAWEHGSTLYDPELHVPLVVTGIGDGLNVEPVSLLDVASTVLQMFGVDAPSSFHGQPLTQPQERTLVAIQKLDGREILSAERGRHKAVLWVDPGPRAEVYDLRRDPAEARPSEGVPPALADPLLDQLSRERPGTALVMAGLGPDEELFVRAPNLGIDRCLGCEFEPDELGLHVRSDAGWPRSVALLRGDLARIHVILRRGEQEVWSEVVRLGERGSWLSSEEGPRVELHRRPEAKTGPIMPPSQEEIEALRALGYLP